MSETPVSTDGTAPPVTPEPDPEPEVAGSERFLGIVGMAVSVFLFVIALDLATGWPSRIAASWAGSDDST